MKIFFENRAIVGLNYSQVVESAATQAKPLKDHSQTMLVPKRKRDTRKVKYQVFDRSFLSYNLSTYLA